VTYAIKHLQQIQNAATHCNTLQNTATHWKIRYPVRLRNTVGKVFEETVLSEQRVVAVLCSMLQCVTMRCSALQCVAVRCSALQCVAVRCSVLQWSDDIISRARCNVTQHVAAWCSVMQCVAVWCSVFRAFQCAAAKQWLCQHSVLQRVAVCCRVLQSLQCVEMIYIALQRSHLVGKEGHCWKQHVKILQTLAKHVDSVVNRHIANHVGTP